MRGRNAQKLSPRRELAGILRRRDAHVVAAVVLDEEVAVAGLGERDLRQPALACVARLWPSSCAVLIAIPLTIADREGEADLVDVERSPLAHSQQANTRPAYCSGMKTYVHQR